MRNPVFRSLPVALALVVTAGGLTAQTLTHLQTVPITHGTIWCIPVYDGSGIVVSAESNAGIQLAKYDLAMNPLGTAVLVATTNDTANQDSIADHKHIFQNGYHYIAFSISGANYLYLLKLNTDFTRMGLATVASNDPPTNDMLLIGDGTNIYVGKFLSGTGHRIYSYDAALNLLGSRTIGGGVNKHANGATAIYADNMFQVIAPDTLAPGQNDRFSRLVFDQTWTCVSNKTTILYDPGVLGLVSGLSRDPVSHSFIVTYGRGAGADGGPIHAAIFDSAWNLKTNPAIVAGTLTRPHSTIVGSNLYLGYDGSALAVSVFAISNAAGEEVTGPMIRANGSTNDIVVGPNDALSITVALQAGEYAGTAVDWWIVALAGPAWYYLNSNLNWTPFDGNLANCHPVLQTGLFNLASTGVLPFALPVGLYTFWFAVDYPMDGILDLNGPILVDSVSVEIQPG